MKNSKGLCLFARVILPINSPPIDDGYILIRGTRILNLGRKKELQFNRTEFQAIDCGDSVIFPGFVNAHAHLDYTCLHGKIPRPKSFTNWVQEIIKAKKQLSDEDYKKSWISGAEMLVRTGCGVVANIESKHNLLPEIWKETPLTVFSLLEILGIKNVGSNCLESIISLREKIGRDGKGRLGLSPHSLYSLSPELLRGCLNFLKGKRVITSMHVAESRDEYEMFKHGKGELIEWLRTLGRDISDCGSGTPVKSLYKYCPPRGLILVHVNYIEEEDVELLKKNKASVVHCPRSFAYFAHEQFHLMKFIKAGINVCIGTDSLASIEKSTKETGFNDGLNMFNEMRQFASVFPDVEPKIILKMATLNGAKTLGLDGKYGDIKAGAIANLVGIPFKGNLSTVYEAIANYSENSVGFSILSGKVVYKSKDYINVFKGSEG